MEEKCRELLGGPVTGRVWRSGKASWRKRLLRCPERCTGAELVEGEVLGGRVAVAQSSVPISSKA